MVFQYGGLLGKSNTYLQTNENKVFKTGCLEILHYAEYLLYECPNTTSRVVENR